METPFPVGSAHLLAAVISIITVLNGYAAESQQAKPAPQKILLHGKDAEVELLTQKWHGVAAGSSMTVGDELGRAKRDLALLNISLRITNASSAVFVVADDFILEGSSLSDAIPLEMALDPNNQKKVDGNTKLQAKSAQTLYLSSPFLSLDKWNAAGRLSLRHKLLPIKLKVAPLPARDVLMPGPAPDSPLAMLKPRITVQRWVAMPRGTSVTSQGKPAVIGRDVAGVEADIEIQNPSSEAVSVPLEFYLVNRTESIRVPLRPTDDMKLSRREQREGVSVPASGRITFRLESTMKSYAELTTWEPLFVHHASCKWKLALSPLPGFDTMRKVGGTGTK